MAIALAMREEFLPIDIKEIVGGISALVADGATQEEAVSKQHQLLLRVFAECSGMTLDEVTNLSNQLVSYGVFSRQQLESLIAGLEAATDLSMDQPQHPCPVSYTHLTLPTKRIV